MLIDPYRFQRRLTRPTPFLLLRLLLFVSITAAPANAATHDVCSRCTFTTIQDAIDAASAGDVVRVLAFTQTEAGILVDRDLTIEGLGMEETVVQAAPTTESGAGRVFTFASGVVASLEKMTVRHGDADFGGGLFSQATELVVEEVRITQNRAKGTGGGISNFDGSSLLLVRSEVIGNLVSPDTDGSSAGGGGIFNDGSLTIHESLIDGNAISAQNLAPDTEADGAGVFSTGPLLLVESSVSSNTMDVNQVYDSRGGGLSLNAPSQIVRSRIEANTGPLYGGGIFAISELFMVDSEVTGNQVSYVGGGLFVDDTLAGPNEMDIVRSAIVDNSAVVGGGIFASGSDLELANVTVSGNQSISHGGGLFVAADATVSLASTTVADNHADSDDDDNGSGGGLYVESLTDVSGGVNFHDTLIVNNTSRVFFLNSSPDCFGTLDSDGYNIVGTLGSSAVSGPPHCEIVGITNGLQTGVAVDLEPLSLYGGLTRSHRLPVGSPAIDAGNPTFCFDYDGNDLVTDQRLALRKGTCDVGSHERGGSPPIFFDGFETGGLLLWDAATP